MTAKESPTPANDPDDYAPEDWDAALAQTTDAELDACRPYTSGEAYGQGGVVYHPIFGVGFVSEALPDRRVRVLFREAGSRVLAHGRSSAAQIRGLPPQTMSDDHPVERTPEQVLAAVDRARAAAATAAPSGLSRRSARRAAPASAAEGGEASTGSTPRRAPHAASARRRRSTAPDLVVRPTIRVSLLEGAPAELEIGEPQGPEHVAAAGDEIPGGESRTSSPGMTSVAAREPRKRVVAPPRRSRSRVRGRVAGAAAEEDTSDESLTSPAGRSRPSSSGHEGATAAVLAVDQVDQVDPGRPEDVEDQGSSGTSQTTRPDDEYAAQILRALCVGVDPLPRKSTRGRRPIPVSGATFAAVMKLYTGLSTRGLIRVLSDEASGGDAEVDFHPNSIQRFFGHPGAPAIIRSLVARSASPLWEVEDVWCQDGDGVADDPVVCDRELEVGSALIVRARVGRVSGAFLDVRLVEDDADDVSRQPEDAVACPAWRRLARAIAERSGEIAASYVAASAERVEEARRRMSGPLRSRLAVGQVSEVFSACLAHNLRRLVEVSRLLSIPMDAWVGCVDSASGSPVGDSPARARRVAQVETSSAPSPAAGTIAVELPASLARVDVERISRWMRTLPLEQRPPARRRRRGARKPKSAARKKSTRLVRT